MVPIIRELYVEKLQEDLKEATSIQRKNKIYENIKLFENNDTFNRLIEKRFTNNQEKYFLLAKNEYVLHFHFNFY
jgi:hypothetical protein